jgi:branched-chain amino acid transport system substrate-binding protein
VVLQCAGSNIAAALIDGVEKHNARNPDNRIIYLNCGAVATELTNEKCSFWHFRFDANAEQKALMLVRALPQETKKVYLLNQDYLFGQSLKHDTEHFLGKYRRDIEIVANELIPLQKIKDFSPYVSKIKASGAQVLITGNWGPDMSLLIKAGMDAGLDVKYYTLYAHLGGGPTAIGPAGEGRVFSLAGFNENVVAEQGDPALNEWVAQFRATHNFDFYAAGFRFMLEYLQAAIQKAGSADPQTIAEALQGMARQDMLGRYPTVMRADDHQLIFPYWLIMFTKDVKYESEKTGLGWKPVQGFEGKDLTLPTTCKMKRPGV